MTVLVVGGRSGDGDLAIDGIGLAESAAYPGLYLCACAAVETQAITAKLSA